MKKILIGVGVLFVIGVAAFDNSDTASDVSEPTVITPETTAPERTTTTVAITTTTIVDQQASVVSYVREIFDRTSNVPLNVSDDEIWQAALAVCSVYDGGGSTYDLATIMSETSGGNADVGALMAAVIVSAVTEICPEYLSELETAVN